MMRLYTKKEQNRFPITTVHQSRLPVFSPFNKEMLTDENVWNYERMQANGFCTKLEVKNNQLNQGHRNFIDAIFTYYKPHTFYDDGSVEFHFTIYDLQKRLQKKSTTNNRWVLTKLNELQASQATITFEHANEKRSITFSILNEHQHIEETRNGKLHLYHSVIFNRNYIQLLENDIHINSQQLTEEIIKLNDYTAQALVRFCLSNRFVNDPLSTVFYKIGIHTDFVSRQTVSKAKSKIKRLFDEQIFAPFGITLSKGKDPTVDYKKHANVWFQNPL